MDLISDEAKKKVESYPTDSVDNWLKHISDWAVSWEKDTYVANHKFSYHSISYPNLTHLCILCWMVDRGQNIFK